MLEFHGKLFVIHKLMSFFPINYDNRIASLVAHFLSDFASIRNSIHLNVAIGLIMIYCYTVSQHFGQLFFNQFESPPCETALMKGRLLEPLFSLSYPRGSRTQVAGMEFQRVTH